MQTLPPPNPVLVEAQVNKPISSACQVLATAVTDQGNGHQQGINNNNITTQHYRKQHRKQKYSSNDDIRNRKNKPPQTEEEDDSFGDQLRHKEEYILRFGSLNINTYPSLDKDTLGGEKMQQLKSILLTGEVDAIPIQEWNKYWPEVPTEDLPHERLRPWTKRLYFNLAFNRGCKIRKGKNLHGGTGIVTVDNAVCRIKGTGRDLFGMGQWCYTRYQGKGRQATRFYSAYRPCRSVSYSARLLIYNQQIAAMATNDNLRCPRVAFLEDLQTKIPSTQSLGDLVVIRADLNTDTTTWTEGRSEMASFIKGFQLTEVVLLRHDPPPAYIHPGITTN